MSVKKVSGSVHNNCLVPTDSKFFYVSFAYVLVDHNTALCLCEAPYWDQPYCYLSLKGDHRKQYEALIPQGLDACLDYYNTHKSNPQFKTRHSEDSRIRMPIGYTHP